MMNSSPAEQHMDSDTVDRTIDFIEKVKPLVISITGGEFTTHPDFFNMIVKFAEALPYVAITLLSNGSFYGDFNKTIDVLKLLEQYHNIAYLQIRTDSAYYPNYDKIMGLKKKLEALNPKIKVYDGSIDLLPFGRAIKNHPESLDSKRKPPCSNPHLIAKQMPEFGLPDFVKYLQAITRTLCKPLIMSNGDIHIGETQTCTKLGTVDDDPQVILDSIKNSVPCDKCGLVKNYTEQERNIIFN